MDQVTVLDEMRIIPAYGFPEAEELPMFAENRVHQRSSGNPYPCRVVTRVDRKSRENRAFRVITLENEYLRVELMPELGGRIYSALDKRTGYDFFYKQHVIKPALIGLLGSWISGGCEFNWPCHHRPSTFMPVDVSIDKEKSGAVTEWMSEHEPLDRMKGMIGVRLAPGEARFDTRMKVYNRTPSRHSFLWWENAAVPVNEHYRLVFPPDVSYVQFHYRKNVTTYPVASGVYNGIRMGDGTDISYHKNTRQPTSYFCAETKYDFFGGYDEEKQCGVIHMADRTVSVGKKMFTWAYHQLSRSWERALTDSDGPYAELMASSYSLNQPDFAWLQPYEGKEFSQLWYPVGAIGTPLCACREAAIAVSDGEIRLQPAVTLQNAVLTVNGREHAISAGPNDIVALPIEGEATAVSLRDERGRTLLRYEQPDRSAVEMPATIPDNPTLDACRTAQDAYLSGVHVEQYRDPAARPDAYFREALRKDPEYAPALTRLAAYELDHLRPEAAYDLATRAWKKVTARNFHPESGELQYLMGRILEALGRDEAAWDWHMQAAWAQDAQSRALTRAAMISGRQGRYEEMAALSARALRADPGNESAAALQVIALRRTDPKEAERALVALLSDDPLNLMGLALLHGPTAALYDALGEDRCQAALDLAENLAEAGEIGFAVQILENLPEKCAQTEYVRAYLTQNETILDGAKALSCGIAYPSRALEARALAWATEQRPQDGNAAFLLGCVLYANGRHREAADAWEKAMATAPSDYRAYRCLAVAYYSHLGQKEKALPLLDQALALRPHDGQLVWETALLMAKRRVPAAEIISFLENEPLDREDVTIELCRAYNRAGAWGKTLSLMEQRNFTPCEGGEHAVAEQFMFAHHALGRRALAGGDIGEALGHFRAAQHLPDHLGSGLWNEVLLVPHRFYEALCLQKQGDQKEAAEIFQYILSFRQDYFTNMHLPELPCWQAMAYRCLGLPAPARELIAAHLRRQQAATNAVDAGYYKTTPFFISYMEDASDQRKAACLWQTAMARFAAGDEAKAAELAGASLALEPMNLYAELPIHS
ncbi:MAG: DUF5107 domain-containing protein [Clostridia bacterium]|nr:DUF5107 domain-containing protein [Clostridia bacterium]